MKNSDRPHKPRGLVVITAALLVLAGLPLWLSARRLSARTTTPSTSVTIVNNSSREIRNVYLSHVDADDWSGDQLSEGSTIAPSHSFTLSNVTCDQQQIKVIGEDQDGCFLSTVVNCGDNSTWTVTNDTSRDCGN
jgi:hypothetical protein